MSICLLRPACPLNSLQVRRPGSLPLTQLAVPQGIATLSMLKPIVYPVLRARPHPGGIDGSFCLQDL